ncbi:MAG: FIST C-terminal domain-containing protein [Chitinophagaceae bacterium]|nr:FIST C-terminal domain-containing protein [Chitinophagaceae bacterium]
MTTSAAVFTSEKTSYKAGIDLAKQIKEEFKHKKPHVIIVFASPVYVQDELLKALKKECTPEILVGCSSAGEFTSEANGVDTVSAVALHSSEMKFFASIGRGIKENRESVVEQLMESMQGIDRFEYRYHSAMLLADALSGYTDEIIDKLTEQTGGTYQFFGGGAGDNAQFKNTCVFFDTEVIPDAVVLLEILSNKPIGLGISHGWYPGSELYRVTEVNESVLISLNAMPAVEVFTDYAKLTGHNFDHDDPIPFFLHNILGIKTEAGYKLRVPLSVNSDGSVTCASNLPVGSLVSIMTTKVQASMEAAETATKKAIGQLQGNKPNIGLFFDCVATRLRLGNNFDFELKAVKNAFNPTKFVGCNTHGQVARMDGQFSGFHNCTAVVCIIPD